MTSDTEARTEGLPQTDPRDARTSEEKIRRPSRTGDFEFEPHHCFACGELNDRGLRLQLHVEPGHCWTELVLDSAFQGWADVAHGGIVATVLDEVMAWSVIGSGTWGVTARMALEFRRPVPVGREVRAEGRVVEATRRLLRTTGRLTDVATHDLLATAAGTYLAAPPDRRAELEARYRLRPRRADRSTETAGSVDAQ